MRSYQAVAVFTACHARPLAPPPQTADCHGAEAPRTGRRRPAPEPRGARGGGGLSEGTSRSAEKAVGAEPSGVGGGS